LLLKQHLLLLLLLWRRPPWRLLCRLLWLLRLRLLWVPVVLQEGALSLCNAGQQPLHLVKGSAAQLRLRWAWLLLQAACAATCDAATRIQHGCDI
jgi:hypothetical protein